MSDGMDSASLQNGEAGRSALFQRFPSGTGAQIYRAATGMNKHGREHTPPHPEHKPLAARSGITTLPPHAG